MRRVQLYLAAIAVAVVPAVLGLWGNASFSQDVPVRVPAGLNRASVRNIATSVDCPRVHARHSR